MNKVILHIKDICYDEQTGLKKRIVFSIILILIGLGIIIWFLYRLLITEGYYNPNNNIVLTDAGPIGDFIGGLSGTLFTLVGVVLLFETLALQRLELSESRKVFEKQQFETTFFNLLNLYNEIIKGLHYNDIDAFEEKTYTGKEFFEKQHKYFYENFETKNTISKNRKRATEDYIQFYTSTKEQTAHYFRTIYRIFRFIEDSGFNPKEKLKYSKIVRAQLSESECFFLYYNAFTDYGYKFRKLINQFHIIKHLPVIEKVEFKNYALQLNQIEKNSVQLVLEETKNNIRNSLLTKTDLHKSYLAGLLSIQTKSTENFSFSLIIIKKTVINISNNYQQGMGLNKFDDITLQRLFSDFLFDLLNYSNYFEFNGKHSNINCETSTDLNNTKHKIEFNVKNPNKEQIKFN